MIPAILDFDNYRSYEGEDAPTTYAQMQTYMSNQNKIIKAIVATVWLQRSTGYNVGDVVYISTANLKYYLVCTAEGTTDTSEIDISSLVVGDTITDGTVVWQLETTAPSIQVAAAPSYYHRQKLMTVEPISVTVYPTWINVGTRGFVSDTSVTLELSTSSSWDNSTYITAANRAGLDFYIYACQQTTSVPKFILSANSTVPTGYTATNSRKIGGFHCLCKSSGTISGCDASGYVTGDIIPYSIWDLVHRPCDDPEGKVWNGRVWGWIYKPSWSNGKMVSAYQGTILNGDGSSPVFTGEGFATQATKQGCRLMTRDEFLSFAEGSNQCTNISTSANPVTAGGHTDTAGRRMISNYFLEDCCGAGWQFLQDIFESFNGNGTSWNSANYYLDGYTWQTKSVLNTDIESTNKGSCIGLVRRVLVGGGWGGGSVCGSRSAICYRFSSYRVADFSCRCASEPRVGEL